MHMNFESPFDAILMNSIKVKKYRGWLRKIANKTKSLIELEIEQQEAGAIKPAKEKKNEQASGGLCKRKNSMEMKEMWVEIE